MSQEKNYNLRPAPPGKFEGGYVIDESVYELMLDGPDEEVGDVFGKGMWYSLLESLDGLDTSDFTEDEKEFIAEQVGAIISEDSQGFVTVEYFDSHKELEKAWREILAWYEEEYV